MASGAFYHITANKTSRPVMGGLNLNESLYFFALGGNLHQALGDEGIGSHSTQIVTLAGTD